MSDISDPKHLALTLLIGHRLSVPKPVSAAELTALREAVEDRIEEAVKDLKHTPAPGGWTTEQEEAHRAMTAAIGLVVERVVPEVPTLINVAPTGAVEAAAGTSPLQAVSLPYTVLCDDNFDMEARSICAGKHATAAEAIAQCQQIVVEFLDGSYKPGMTAAELYDLYTMFGEDPWVVGLARGTFSAWDYARQRCDEICRRGFVG